MILYDLRCRKGHVFEAWFRDSAAYDGQVAAGGIACPTCGSKKVEKAPMAPRLSRGALTEAAGANAEARSDAAERRAEAETAKAAKAMRELRELRRKVEANCDYVGGAFAEEARKIHYGEAHPHNIYGETSDEEAKALNDEGVSFARIPWPARHDC
jgi:hypothetical protein